MPYSGGEVISCGVPASVGMSYSSGMSGWGVSGGAEFASHGGVTVCRVPDCVGVSYSDGVTVAFLIVLGCSTMGRLLVGFVAMSGCSAVVGFLAVVGCPSMVG